MNQPCTEILVEFQSLSSAICFQGELCQQHREAEFQQPLIGHSKVSQDGPLHPALPEPV